MAKIPNTDSIEATVAVATTPEAAARLYGSISKLLAKVRLTNPTQVLNFFKNHLDTVNASWQKNYDPMNGDTIIPLQARMEANLANNAATKIKNLFEKNKAAADASIHYKAAFAESDSIPQIKTSQIVQGVNFNEDISSECNTLLKDWLSRNDCRIDIDGFIYQNDAAAKGKKIKVPVNQLSALFFDPSKGFQKYMLDSGLSFKLYKDSYDLPVQERRITPIISEVAKQVYEETVNPKTEPNQDKSIP